MLVFVLLLSLSPASAVEVDGYDVIFTIINNDLAPLRTDTMPTVVDGMLYLPYSIFTGNFGIMSIYNSRDNLLILSNENKTLFFSTTDGGCYDRDGTTYNYSARTINGQSYVPAVFVSSIFGLLCSYYPISSVVRVKDTSISYTDNYLISSLADEMQTALDEYIESVKQAEEPELVPFDLYFAFSGALGQETETLLDVLEELGIHAAFFLTQADILANEALVRRIYVAGHTLGLLCEAEALTDPETMLAAFDDANHALDRVLNQKTRLVMIPGGSNAEVFTESHREALRTGGYRYWDSTLSPELVEEDTTSADVLEALTERFMDVTATTVLCMDYAPQYIGAIPGICAFLKEHACTILMIDALRTPVNFHADLW